MLCVWKNYYTQHFFFGVLYSSKLIFSHTPDYILHVQSLRRVQLQTLDRVCVFFDSIISKCFQQIKLFMKNSLRNHLLSALHCVFLILVTWVYVAHLYMTHPEE